MLHKQPSVDRESARKLSAQIDRLLANSGRDPDEGARVDGSPSGPEAPTLESSDGDDDVSAAVAEELQVARRLNEIVAQFPPVPVDLDQRVRDIVHSRPVYVNRSWRPAVLSALATALIFLVVWFVVPNGVVPQRSWAQVMDVLLGQTRVELTPTLEAGQAHAVREPLRDLVAAEMLMGRAPSVPKTLPDDYELQEVAAVSYPDLPSWVSQPFYIELCYGTEGTPSDLHLRQYRLLFKELGGLGNIQVASGAVVDLEQIDVGGATGMLLTLEPGVETSRPTYTLLWERDGLLHELESDSLSRQELLETARSVR
jgi:hypothetical protein